MRNKPKVWRVHLGQPSEEMMARSYTARFPTDFLVFVSRLLLAQEASYACTAHPIVLHSHLVLLFFFVPQSPRARKIRDNFGAGNAGNSSPDGSDPAGTAQPVSPAADADAGAGAGSGVGPRALWGIVRKQAGSGFGAGAERGAVGPTEVGQVEEGQGAKKERGQRFRWVARVASRVSSVGKRARGRVVRIVGGDDESLLPGQEYEDSEL